MSNIILLKNNSREELLNKNRKNIMKHISPRVRAPINTSKKIYTVDQSEPGFYLTEWIDKFKKSKSSKYFWIFKDEISLYSKEYKEFLGESVFRDVLLDVKKYGSCIGFLS